MGYIQLISIIISSVAAVCSAASAVASWRSLKFNQAKDERRRESELQKAALELERKRPAPKVLPSQQTIYAPTGIQFYDIEPVISIINTGEKPCFDIKIKIDPEPFYDYVSNETTYDVERLSMGTKLISYKRKAELAEHLRAPVPFTYDHDVWVITYDILQPEAAIRLNLPEGIRSMLFLACQFDLPGKVNSTITFTYLDNKGTELSENLSLQVRTIGNGWDSDSQNKRMGVYMTYKIQISN